MRIPTSTIVMTLVLAAPVALAIRDTLKHPRSPREDAEDEMQAQVVHEAAEQDRIEAEDKAAAEGKRAKSEAALAMVIGARPAQLGKLFDGVVLGAPLDSYEPDSAKAAIDAAERDDGMSVTLDADSAKLVTIDVVIDGLDGNVCRTMLARSWGVPAAGGVWIDPTAHQRATVDDSIDACSLRFDRYDEPNAWVDKLPLATVGAPAKKLALDASAYVTDHEIDWRGPGVGAGHNATNYTFSIDAGKVTHVLVIADADPDSLDAITARLSAKLGAQPKKLDDYGGGTRYEWTSRTPVTLVETEHQLSIDIGAEPAR